MSTAVASPAPSGNGLNRKGSRKGKKAWRKNVDITDVERNLDELRAEERTTGGKVHQQPNESLFVFDTQGDGKVQKELRKDRPLKMDEILAQRSKVPAVSGRRTSASTISHPTIKKNAKISKAEKAKLLDLIKRKTSNSLFAPVTKPLGRSGMTDAVRAAGKFDIWADDNEEEEEEDMDRSEDHQQDDSKMEVDDFIVDIVTKAPVKAPKSFKQKQKVAIPAVKEAHPGASYNPTMKDHQSLLLLAHNDEVKSLEQWENLNAQLAYPKELDQMVAFDDRTGGLLEDSDEEEEEEEEGEEEEEEENDAEDSTDVKSKKQKGKKTITERNRLARAAEKAKEEARIKRDKDLNKQTNRVKEIMKVVEEEEADMERKHQESDKKKEQKEKAGMKRVGRFNVPKERIEVQLQDELSESLRQLKPEGNLLKTRFQSFVERNLIEPRVPVAKRRRYRLKTYEKHSYKRFDNPNHA
ncbi:MAG: ribosome biogenesis protein Nop53/GLTSCR2 [Benniella sp.]|nr:MAG: ribosome biogenesis protein Nop53/GLTSCR2 [Benniella sp.]